ncbi:MAG: uncharacterized protein QG577_2029 [Thermodesulfobacteriota bacterium]|nr:uncharacterized protein [Thermodesulfobacteriota bacterium]
MPPFLKPHKQGVVLSVKVIPGSSRAALSLDKPDVLTVRLTAPPVEGKANKELIRVLAKKLHLAASNVTIISGETSRTKAVLIRDMDMETVGRLLSSP